MTDRPTETGGDSEERLLRQVREAAQTETSSNLPPTETTTRDEHGLRASEPLPDQIGPYKILRILGEGGMGTVFLAEQQKPIRRQVALKSIKLGMDTKRVIARFDAERQALAVMDHPHVAKVFDAGATQQGRPYFIMEYVQGDKITDYCDRHRLDIHARLQVFLQICEALQHAHQKGIIHRDIKPSNILVATQDGKSYPKVIDFGIAKATADPLTEHSLFTEQGQVVGTPAYMSPEQAEGRPSDIDTRTDIYSLGVLLYELLVGVSPLDPQTLRDLSPVEISHLVRVKEPLRPSARITSLGDEASRVATHRQSNPRSLMRSLRGDLDWIVLRSMEKLRERRYQTVSEFANDIRRHLRHEPVLAGPPGTIYRLRKFVRRYRGAVAATAIVFLALTAGLTASLILYSRAEAERNRANTKAETAHRVKEAMVDMFNAPDPSEANGNTITAREILDRGVISIQEQLKTEPEVQGALLATMGRVYNQLGLAKVARELLEQAVDIQRGTASAPDGELADSLYQLGIVLVNFGEFEEAGRMLEQSLSARREIYGKQSMQVANTINTLASLHHQTGDMERAIELHRQAIDAFRGALGGDHARVASALVDLSALYQDLGRLDEARSLYEQALEMHRRLLGPDHLDVALDLHYLGTLAQAQNDLNGAEQYLRDAIKTYRNVFEGDHAYLASAYNTLGGILHDKKDYTAAIGLYQQALDMHQRLFGDDNPYIAGDMTGLAAVYRDQGQLDRAEGMLREALAIRRKHFGNDHMRVGITLTSLGVCLTKMKRFEPAEKAFLEAHRILSTAVEETSPRYIRVCNGLATLYEVWGKPEETAKYCAPAKATSGD